MTQKVQNVSPMNWKSALGQSLHVPLTIRIRSTCEIGQVAAVYACRKDKGVCEGGGGACGGGGKHVWKTYYVPAFCSCAIFKRLSPWKEE